MSGDDEVLTLKVRWTLSSEDIEFKVKKKTPDVLHIKSTSNITNQNEHIQEY